MGKNTEQKTKKESPSLTDKQLELAKKEIAKKEQQKQKELNKRRLDCQKEIEAACEKHGMQLQAPVTREDILNFASRLFNPTVSAVGAVIQLIEKPEEKK